MKNIDLLRTFFRASNAVFDFKNRIGAILGNTDIGADVESMENLHRLALVEVEKDEPDAAVLDDLLAKMQAIAEAIPAKKV